MGGRQGIEDVIVQKFGHFTFEISGRKMSHRGGRKHQMIVALWKLKQKHVPGRE